MVAPADCAVADKLREMDVLEQQQADGFRTTAYRRAANTLELLQQSVGETVQTDALLNPLSCQ